MKGQSKGFYDRQQHYGDQDHSGKLIEPTVKDMTSDIAVVTKVVHQFQTIEVIGDEQANEQQFDAQPLSRQQHLPGVTDEQPQSEERCSDSSDGHHSEEFAFHDLETCIAFAVCTGGVVNEQARQIEQSCKPRHDEDDVPSFDP